jgi:hypothetical protein
MLLIIKLAFIDRSKSITTKLVLNLYYQKPSSYLLTVIKYIMVFIIFTIQIHGYSFFFFLTSFIFF